MRKSLLGLFFLLFCFYMYGQRLHTPSEVQQYMEKSSINFSFDTLTEEFTSKGLTLVEEGYFLIITDSGFELEKREFTLSPKAKKYIAKAKKFERRKKVAKSIKFLKRAHDMHPENMRVMKYLGSLYLENNQAERSISLLENVVEINDIDFEAHSLLAVAYHKTGQKKNALKQISLAHLLNRNHKKIIEILKVIYLENGLPYSDYVFEPKYKIDTQDTLNISIQANEIPWKAYAACKTLWMYDSEYKKGMMNFSNIDITKVEEKECLLNALLSYEQMETGKEDYPLLEYLGASLEKEMVNDFILYEIKSRENPMMMSLLSKERLESVAKYLMSIRVGKEIEVR